MKFRVETVEQAVGVVAAVLATAISTSHILAHLRHNKTPLWGCTVRILVVVPIFALNGGSSLLVEVNRKHWSSPLNYVCELYESVAMISFMQLILAFLGGPTHLACRLRRELTAPVKHVWPFRHVVRQYEVGADFVSRANVGILQYALVSAILFVLNCLLWRPPWDTRKPWFQETHAYIEATIKVTKSLSCGWAMYNLVLFYHTVQSLLGSCRPLLKFMSIKGIIFFTFWQGIVIFVLGHAGVIPDSIIEPDGEVWYREDISKSLNFLLVCLEMPFFAVMHVRAYPLPHGDELEVGQCSEPEFGMPSVRTAGPGLTAGTLWQFFGEVRALRREAKLQVATQDSPLQSRQSSLALDSTPGTVIGSGIQQELSTYISRPSTTERTEVLAGAGSPPAGDTPERGALTDCWGRGAGRP